MKMRIIYIWFAAAFLMVLVMARGTAIAGEQAGQSTVPYRVSQIEDPTLRSALAMYKPNYDALSRQEQVGSFVNIYRSLHGAPPSLSATDAGLNAAHVAAISAPEPWVSRYEPWHDPVWQMYGDIGVLGLGLHWPGMRADW